MFVSYSTSNVFAIHTGISMISLFENNRSEESITVFVIDLGIDEDNKGKLFSIAQKYGREIEFLSVDEVSIREFLGSEIPEHYGSLATYVRLCATFTYPSNVHKIMYIDSDMVICGSLHEVYTTNMGSRIVAAVPEKRDIDYLAGSSKEEAMIVARNPLYFNGGFLIIDLDNWKKENINTRIRKAVTELHEFVNKDQSILNYALRPDEIYRLPFKYNYPMHRYPRYLMKKWAKDAAPLTYDEVIEADQAPVIIHYKGSQSRPWFKENTSCMAEYYYRYKRQSPYADVPLESIFDSSKFQNASFIGKTYMKLVYAVYQKPIGYPIFLINKLRIDATIRAKKRGQ